MGEEIVTFDSPQSTVFEVNAESRTIKGLVLPYGVTGDNGLGKYTFAKGTVSWPQDMSRVKLLVGHDFDKAVGYATALEDSDAGVVGTFKVARGEAGDKALSLAEDKVFDGLSAGIGRNAKFKAGRDGVFSAISAPVAEVSLTPLPAFDDARVTSVAASAVPKKEITMDENTPVKEDAPNAGVDLSKTITDAIAAGFAAIADTPKDKAPAAGRPVAFVDESPLYRFDGVRGTHDFSEDLISYLKSGDAEAGERVLNFMGSELGPKFVDSGDTTAVNPEGYRADMFVNEQRYTTPLRNAFYKGTLTDITPFSFSKFDSASGLVGDHVEGVEPNPGNYSTAKAATITPAPVSGKVHITREVWDQGGNPQVSALIWSKVQYEYMQAMEQKVAALLNASNPDELGTAVAAGATPDDLADAVEQAIALLNFIAGGNRFNYTAGHIDLYLALSNLKASDGRPRYPQIGPANVNGQTTTGFKSITVAGNRFDPVWSLGTTPGNGGKSYVADTSAVYFWHSAPQRLDRLQERVEGFDIGVWGYQAGVISDLSGLRKITYDPSAV